MKGFALSWWRVMHNFSDMHFFLVFLLIMNGQSLTVLFTSSFAEYLLLANL